MLAGNAFQILLYLKTDKKEDGEILQLSRALQKKVFFYRTLKFRVCQAIVILK
jgi:hypothetical protein